MLTKLQIGYIAGLLDGEGQIGICKNARRDDRKRERNYALRPLVRVGQRRRLLLDTVLSWIGNENGSIGRYGLGQRFFLLKFKTQWLRDNLPEILPHLILKRRQAEIVLEFLNYPARVGRNGVGEAEWQRRDRLRDECKALNLDRTNAEA